MLIYMSTYIYKVIVAKFTRGTVRGALQDWNTCVAWRWTPEFRRFWNSMRRLDRLIAKAMVRWKRHVTRALWFQHVAASRQRSRVFPVYVRASFYGWEKIAFPPRESARSHSRGAD